MCWLHVAQVTSNSSSQLSYRFGSAHLSGCCRRCLGCVPGRVSEVLDARGPLASTKVEVHLSEEARAGLEAICRQRCMKAARRRRARMLLLAYEEHRE